MITELNHVSFTVSDLDNSVRFYRDVLGLRLKDISDRDPSFSEKVTGIEGAKLRIAYLAIGDHSLELIEYVSSKGSELDTRTNNVGSSHVCVIVTNFEEFVNRLRENDVQFSGTIERVPGGPNKGKQVAYFKDPDGNNIEVLSSEVSGE